MVILACLCLFGIFFFGMWCVALLVLSKLSGWSKLAGRFGLKGAFRGRTWRFRSARMNAVSFGAVLSIGAGKEGLYLALILPFSLFNKPLLIPWSEIETEPLDRWWFRGYRLTFRSCPGVRLDLRSGTFDAVKSHLETLSAPPTQA